MMFLLNSSSHTSLSSSAPITWSSSFSINVSFLKICAKFRFEIRNTQNIEPGKMSSRVSKAVLTFWKVRGSYFQRRQRFFLTKLQTAEIWQQNINMNEETRFLSPPEVISSDIVATMKLLKLKKSDSLFNSLD